MLHVSNVSTADQLVLTLQIGIGAALGGVIGWERDRAGKSAGIRTHMLVAASSAFAVGLGELLLAGGSSGDHTRVLHAVITGIGFIGGGMIWTAKKSRGPAGLTSAATIMLVAVIGAAAGLGAPIVATTVTIFALITLSGVRRIENMFRSRRSQHDDEYEDGSAYEDGDDDTNGDGAIAVL